MNDHFPDDQSGLSNYAYSYYAYSYDDCRRIRAFTLKEKAALLVSAPFDVAPVATDDARTPFYRVPSEAGAILPRRGPVDDRLFHDAINGWGGLTQHEDEVGGYPDLAVSPVSRPVKIVGTAFYPVATPRETGALSRHLLIRIDTDAGISGWGERSDMDNPEPAGFETFAAAQAAATERVTGADPHNVNDVLARLDGLYTSTFEIGLHDLLGKLLGVPVHVLLGGQRRDRIPVCYPIFGVTADTVDDNLARVQRAIDLGFTRIRKYVSRNLDAEEDFLGRLRERFGWDLEITALDLSARFEWQESLALLERFKPYRYQLAESVGKGRGDVEGMARVRAALGLPISEHLGGFQQIIDYQRAGAVDVVNRSTHGCGVRRSKAILDFAGGIGLRPLHGTTQELSLGTAAAAHVCATLETLDVASYPAGPKLYLADCTRTPIRYEDSAIVVPDGPGLGIDVDEELLEGLRYAS